MSSNVPCTLFLLCYVAARSFSRSFSNTTVERSARLCGRTRRHRREPNARPSRFVSFPGKPKRHALWGRDVQAEDGDRSPGMANATPIGLKPNATSHRKKGVHLTSQPVFSVFSQPSWSFTFTLHFPVFAAFTASHAPVFTHCSTPLRTICLCFYFLSRQVNFSFGFGFSSSQSFHSCTQQLQQTPPLVLDES